jgi:hypothetical protein
MFLHWVIITGIWTQQKIIEHWKVFTDRNILYVLWKLTLNCAYYKNWPIGLSYGILHFTCRISLSWSYLHKVLPTLLHELVHLCLYLYNHELVIIIIVIKPVFLCGTSLINSRLLITKILLLIILSISTTITLSDQNYCMQVIPSLIWWRQEQTYWTHKLWYPHNYISIFVILYVI